MASKQKVEIYLNTEMRRAIDVIQEKQKAAGDEPLSDKQFVKTATVEKIKRDLGVEIREQLRDTRSRAGYRLSEGDDEEIQG